MVRKPPYSFKRLVNVYKVRLNVYKIKRYAHPYAIPLLSSNIFGAPGQERPNFDGFIYVYYAAPPYSARVGAI